MLLIFRLRQGLHCLKEHVAEERTNDASLMYGRMVGNLQQQLHQQVQMASAANAANAARVQKEQEKVQSMVALEQHHHHQRLVHLTTRVREIGLYDTCWWYSLCNFQYRQYYENTGSDHFDC